MFEFLRPRGPSRVPKHLLADRNWGERRARAMGRGAAVMELLRLQAAMGDPSMVELPVGISKFVASGPIVPKLTISPFAEYVRAASHGGL
jgi:hypothetical protein